MKKLQKEHIWYGDVRITKLINDKGQIIQIREHIKQPDGKLLLQYEENREYWENGNVKCAWTSNDEMYDFDINGNLID